MTTPDANGWMPIQSAPKDWSDVILHVPYLPSDWRTVCEGYFDPENAVWCSPSFKSAHLRPTHWQPLPKPPVSEASK